eukprot:286859-Rhodomonas_salina.2
MAQHARMRIAGYYGMSGTGVAPRRNQTQEAAPPVRVVPRLRVKGIDLATLCSFNNSFDMPTCFIVPQSPA